MAKRNDINVRIGANTAQFNKALKATRANTQKYKSEMKQLGKSIVAAYSIYSIANFAKQSVEAADVQLKAEAKLLQALEGRTAMMKRLTAQASELQKNSLYGDEATIEAQSRLAMILGANEDAITQLMPLIQDFAAAKSLDLVQATELVAKSVGSETNSLSRYGLQIEGAVGSTDRLNSAVNALSGQFKGQAKIVSETGLGPITQFSNAWGDLSEEFGKNLLPYLTKVSIGLKKIIENLDVYGAKVYATGSAVGGFLNSLANLDGFGNAGMSAGKEYAKAYQEYLDAAAEHIDPEIEAFAEKIANFNKEELLAEQAKIMESVETEGSAIFEAAMADYLNLLQTRLNAMKPVVVTPKITRSDAPGKMESKSGPSSVMPSLLDENHKEFVKQWEEKITVVQNAVPNVIEQMKNLEFATINMGAIVGPALTNVTSSFAQAMGDILSGSTNIGDLFSSLMNVIADFMKSFGEALISASIAAIAFSQLLLNPFAALAAGVALVALSQVVTNLLGDGPQQEAPALANGGLAFGPTMAMIGDNPNAASDPEVIAPLSKLQNYMGGGDITVHGNLHGNDILVSSERSGVRRRRERGQ